MSTEPLPPYEQLEPRAVWSYFAGLAAVPRPSKKEERVRAHVRALAEELGFAADEDGAGNLVVKVDAKPGYEDVPSTALQAHLDMVCEKNTGTVHDFDRDPIRLMVDRDAEGALTVRADGTTLGADNGLGVALALAAAADPRVAHGPLELVFTVDEEEGMGGAEGLDPSLIAARRLINLDTEEDAALYVGCAGGCDTNLTWRFSAGDAAEKAAWKVELRGLRGGHSGGDIHLGRGSATKLLARVLGRLGNGWSLVHIEGGSKRNAIPREAAAVVCGADLEPRLRQAALEVAAEARQESGEAELTIEMTAAAGGRALSPANSRLLIRALEALPHGPVGMHPDIPTLVETSNNLATLACDDEGSEKVIRAGTLSRSSSASRLQEVLHQIAAVGDLSGAEVEHANAYPGWAPNMESPTLQVCRQVHLDLFGAEPKVAAVHAGLECGLLGRRLPGIDMVSLGPRIEGAHSPDETAWVASVERSWEYLTAILDRLARTGAA